MSRIAKVASATFSDRQVESGGSKPSRPGRQRSPADFLDDAIAIKSAPVSDMDVVFLYDIWTCYSIFWVWESIFSGSIYAYQTECIIRVSGMRQSHICLMHMETKPWKTDIEDHGL